MKWLLVLIAFLTFPHPAMSQDASHRHQATAIKLRSYDRPDLVLAQHDMRGIWQAPEWESLDDQWLIVPGLADLNLVSLESMAFRGHYLTQEGERVFLRQDDRNPDTRRRATFRLSRTNSFAQAITLESLASPGFFLSRSNETSDALLKTIVTIDELKAASFIDPKPHGDGPGPRPEPVIRTVFESMWFPGYVLRIFGEDIRPTPLQEINPKSDAVFLQRRGLTGSGTVSLESASKPGYFMRARQGRMRLEAFNQDKDYLKDASFIKVPGLADSRGVSFQAITNPAYYIGVNGFYEVYLTFISNDVDQKLVTFFETTP